MINKIYSKFFNSFYAEADAIASPAGISTLFVLAVAALESGFGKYAPRNNFFGIKASASYSKPKFTAKTKEFDPLTGEFIQTADSFRAYANFADSCRDFCTLIRHKYNQCLGISDASVCYKLQENPRRRYASDPAYSKKLESLFYIFLSVMEESSNER